MKIRHTQYTLFTEFILCSGLNLYDMITWEHLIIKVVQDETSYYNFILNLEAVPNSLCKTTAALSFVDSHQYPSSSLYVESVLSKYLFI